MNLQLLIGPLVGAGIGYITNSIAIKMLFRPLKPVYVFGIKLPFTPGMIPKERERIANTVGQVVGAELINQEALREHLLSQEMYVKLERSIQEWFVKQQHAKHTIREALIQMSSQKTVDGLSCTVKEQMTSIVYEKLMALELGGPLAATACQQIKGNLGALAMFLNDGLIASAEVKLEEIINQMIKEQAQEVIGEVIEREGEALLDTPIEKIANELEESLPKIKYVLLKQYTSMVENQLADMLKSVDLPHIVASKIKSYDLLEMEKLILSIMEKELKAIVWLGALLGGIMGIFMSIF
ncbi:MAG: DUF445 domain-containing protein [Cellulosilyticaceae bacterium]